MTSRRMSKAARSDWEREMEQATICQCGHDFSLHVPLPGFPGEIGRASCRERV